MHRPLPSSIAPFFVPPPDYAADLGRHSPLLRFYDGSPVRTPEDWPRRREEIRARWHAMMGPWPPLIDSPAIEYLAAEHADNFTLHTVAVELAADWPPWTCYLLVPDGDGPFPAAVAVYYDPDTPAGRGQARQSALYAVELARRGFVALSVGRTYDYDHAVVKGMPTGGPGEDCYYPDRDRPRLQPCSFQAYVAANAWNALAGLTQVDPARIGIVGHSYGGKWAMFGACLWDRFACAAFSDAGVTIFHPTNGGANYADRWYLGCPIVDPRGARLPTAYQQIRKGGHDLHELLALMAPRPFFVSGCLRGTDRPVRWRALNHVIGVNRLLGFQDRVAMSSSRRDHSPTPDSDAEIYSFFEHFLARR